MIPPLPHQTIDSELSSGHCAPCEGCGDGTAWTEHLPSVGRLLWCSWRCYVFTDGKVTHPELREELAKYLAWRP